MNTAELRVALILDGIPDGLTILDRDWRYTYLNRAAERMMDRARADLLGKRVWDEFPLVVGTEVERQLRRVMAEHVACEFDGYSATAKRWYENRAAPAEGGGVAVYFRDITERKRDRENLRRSEALLSEAQQLTHIGSWSWDFVTDELTWSDEHYRIFGLRPEDVPMTRDRGFSYIHPDDRGLVTEAMDHASRTRQAYDCCLRVVREDGEVRFAQSRGHAVYDAHGVAIRMFGTLQDITDRKKMEDALLEATRHKDEFLAMLGHELRNPLAPLRATIETLRTKALDPKDVQRAYGIMDRQVSHLERLVDDLLDVSRITRGVIELHKRPLDLAEPIHQAIEMAAPAILGRRHELTLSLPSTTLRVEGDSARLTQVFYNLLSNAAKYTEPDGRIWLTAQEEDGDAVVRVADNGNGMEPELVPFVFDLFTQGHRPLDRPQGGLGLGLPLVRRLVEMHGGSVEGRSGGLGKGSEFLVRLRALAPSAEIAPQGVSPPRAPQVAAHTDVLVVDDDLDVVESMVMALDGLARDIRVAHSGAQAIEVLRGWHPDVVFMDIGMPGMDGYEVARRLRQDRRMDDVLIVALTGYGAEEDRRRSKEAGFDRHLVKPTRRTTLEDVMERGAKAK